MFNFPPLFCIALLALIILLVFFAFTQSWTLLVALAVVFAAVGNCLRGNTGLPFFLSARKAGRTCIWLALGLVAGVGGLLNLQGREQAAFAGVDYNRVQAYSGAVVKDSTSLTGGKTSWDLELATVSAPEGQFAARGRVRVFYAEAVRYYQGEQLIVQGRLVKASTLPGVQFTSSGRDVRQLGFRNGIAAWRVDLKKQLDAAIDQLGYPAAELFRGLFLGDKTDFPVTLALGFTKTGTVHLLALSGMNVGIIFGLLWLLLTPLPRRLGPLKLGLIAVVLLFYLWLTGMEPSLCRATVMLFLTWCSLIFWQRTNPLAILGLALLIILFFDPLAAFSLGLQLSFLAMAGIILFTPRIQRFLTPYLPSWATAPLATSLAAQITTLPLVLLNFGVYYPVNILVTILLIPLTTVYMWVGMGALGLFCLAPLLKASLPASWFNGWLGIMDLSRWLLNGLYHMILAINNFFAVWPGLLVSTAAPVLKISMLGYGLLVLGWLLKKRSKPARPLRLQTVASTIASTVKS